MKKPIEPIDADWDFKIACIDGKSGYKHFPPPKAVKRTLRKNRPWEYCYIIIRWEDTDDNGYDYCFFKYDQFSIEAWQTQVNFYDWVYDGEWEIVADGVFNDHKEFSKVYNEVVKGG